jgi:hypothetical protein
VCMCVHTYFAVYSCVCMTAISVCWLLLSNKVVISYYKRGVGDNGPMMEGRHWPAKQLLISFDTSCVCMTAISVCI